MEARAYPAYARIAAPEAGLRRRRCALAGGLALAAAAALALAVAGRRGAGASEAPGRGAATLGLAEAKGGACTSKFVLPDEPKTATELNGVALNDVCFTDKGPHHVFIIGDWGGLKKDGKIAAASHLNHRWNKTQNFQFIWPTDTDAQRLVAKQMQLRAPTSKPEYILNMGDNFYWGGVTDYCGADFTVPYSGGGSAEYHKEPCDQWKEIFEDFYNGPGIDGLMWLGVMGNHDWGGWRFDMAWDQAIGYTWSKAKTSKKRWLTPSLYYSVKVKYDDFSVDYWFMDTNVFDALPYGESPTHNICGPHNPGGAANPKETKPRSCASQGGPASTDSCQSWFQDLWHEQKEWLAKGAKKSTAEWRIVVTHFPPYWGKHEWIEMSKAHEIDAIITGHRHSQNMHCDGDNVAKIWSEDPHSTELNDFLDPTAWVVSGGGGGITSEHIPSTDGEDDQYGFVDMLLTKDTLTFWGISHGGVERRRMAVGHSYSHGGVNTVKPKSEGPRCRVHCGGLDCTKKPEKKAKSHAKKKSHAKASHGKKDDKAAAKHEKNMHV